MIMAASVILVELPSCADKDLSSDMNTLGVWFFPVYFQNCSVHYIFLTMYIDLHPKRRGEHFLSSPMPFQVVLFFLNGKIIWKKNYRRKGNTLRNTLLVLSWSRYCIKTTLILHNRNSTKCLKYPSEILVYIGMIASRSWRIFIGCASIISITAVSLIKIWWPWRSFHYSGLIFKF